MRTEEIFRSLNRRTMKAFCRFHLIVTDACSSQHVNAVSALFDLILDEGNAADAYLHSCGKAKDDTSFVPPSFAAILHFRDCVDDALAADPSRLITLRVPRDLGAASAAAFLVGA